MRRDRRRLTAIILWGVPCVWIFAMAGLHWASLERYVDHTIWWERIGQCVGVSEHPQAGYVLVSYKQETVSCAEVLRRYPEVMERLQSFRAFNDIDDTVYWIAVPLLIYVGAVWLTRRWLSARQG